MRRRSEASLRALINRALTRTSPPTSPHTAFEGMHDAKLPSDITEVTDRAGQSRAASRFHASFPF